VNLPRFDARRDAIAVAFDSAKDEEVWAVIYDGQMFA
jgi:hypothetical protein